MGYSNGRCDQEFGDEYDDGAADGFELWAFDTSEADVPVPDVVRLALDPTGEVE